MAFIDALLPDGLGATAALFVIAASFFTSALTATFGLGGGLALLAVMGATMPTGAVVPVHGVAQLGSNAGRFLLQRRHVAWKIALWFAAGSALGALIGAKLFVALPERVLAFLIGAFVLATVWGPKPKGFAPGSRAFFATGAASGLLSMFVGATGPIAAAMLKVAALDRERTVATHAGCMTFQHALKAAAFGFVGFSYREWAPFIALVIATGFLGTLFGVRLLRSLPEEKFRKGFNLVLTFFGVYLIASALL